MGQFGRFIRELGKYRGAQLWIAFLTLISALLSLQTPGLIKQIFNFLDPRKSEPFHLPGPFSSLTGAFVLLILVSLASGLMSYVMGVTIQAMGQRFLLDTRVKLYTHLQGLSQGFFEKSQTGKIVATVVNDVGQVNGLITGAFVTIIQDSVTLIGVLILIFMQNAHLALLALSVYPIYILNYLLSRKGLSDNASKISELRGVILSDLQEKLAGIQVVKSYAQERSEVRSYTHLNRDNLNLNIRQNGLGTWLWVRAELITAVGTAVVLCVGGQAVIKGDLRQGDLVAFLVLVTAYLYAPTIRLIQLNDQLARSQTSLRRIFDLLDTAPVVVNNLKAPALPKIAGRVVYEHVKFAYEPEQYVLKGIDLTVEPGQMIAFVGGSGSGKTTMISLLSRHYDVVEGRITIDGHDLREIELYSLRQQIGVVLQESILFHATIRENLKYGKLDATDEELAAAVEAANLTSVIEALPQGYDTKIGEEGVKLSVGEKQRLAIARALLADPRILVLDEATSSLDSETETLIQEALDRLMTNRTSFVIAHRLSTIVKADKIVVMELGEIKEMGTHSELLEQGGIYARLYAEQFRAELEAGA
ncbi:ABC transporter ATP-binding protein [Armatimonas rosea]|uniref:Subfamily B ATP-binding cassette protein MsbA n=1 Tax=Armatimonas rosea TaxID=685828 RepID=A0A7W9W9G7_ARMRO|nr:ABC transporter ATP-binding protein [Armatimonas rosea]MBB6052592.1 subfamily B ATP-binding cassette protein MsbA [Armatimonas rosea]